MKAIQFATISNFRKSHIIDFTVIQAQVTRLHFDNVFFHSKVQYSIEIKFFPNSWQLRLGTYEVFFSSPHFFIVQNMKIEINAQGDLIEVDRLWVKQLLFGACPDEDFSQQARSHSEHHSDLQQYPLLRQFLSTQLKETTDVNIAVFSNSSLHCEPIFNVIQFNYKILAVNTDNHHYSYVYMQF